MTQPSEREVYLRHARVHLQLLRQMRERYERGGEEAAAGLRAFAEERRQLEAGQSWCDAHAKDDSAAAQLCIDYARAGTILLGLRGQRDSARWLEAAVSVARRGTDRRTEADLLSDLADAHAALGNYRTAIERYERALAVLRELGDALGEHNVLDSMGTVYADAGEPRRAIELHQQVLEFFQKTGDRRREAGVLDILGAALEDVGEPGNATGHYERALALFQELGDRRGAAEALCSLGGVRASSGELRRAIDCYEQAVCIFAALQEGRSRGDALVSLADVRMDYGEWEGAIKCYEEAAAAFRVTGDLYREASVQLDLTRTFGRLGDRRKAIYRAEKALGLLEEIGDRRCVEVRRWLARWRTDPGVRRHPEM